MISPATNFRQDEYGGSFEKRLRFCLEVLEAVEGEIILNDCLESRTACARSLVCSVHPIWARARDKLRKSLGEVNFASLAEKETTLKAPSGE